MKAVGMMKRRELELEVEQLRAKLNQEKKRGAKVTRKLGDKIVDTKKLSEAVYYFSDEMRKVAEFGYYRAVSRRQIIGRLVERIRKAEGK